MTDRFDATTTTTCGYCGVGCRLEAHRVGGRIMSISPAMDGPANKGHTCVKGRFAHQFSRSRDRLTAPLVRESGGFRLASWDEAIGRIVDAFGRIKSEHGPDAIAGLASSRATNEDCYVMQRLMRAAIGTHNIDNCSRVCHSPTSFALRKSFGLSGATGSFDDIEAAEVALLIGVNPTQGHPVVGARIKQAAHQGPEADHRRPAPDRAGRLRPAAPGQCGPGTNAALLNGLATWSSATTWWTTSSWPSAPRATTPWPSWWPPTRPRAVEEITGVPAADIVAAAHLYAGAERACILWGLGVTEHLYGSECVQLICNLALLTGNVGRPGAALLPLRGQNNVQGSSDHGALPDTFTDYRRSPTTRSPRAFEQRWGVEMKRERGMKIPEMFDAAVEGRLKAMYIFGEDVAQTDPDTEHVDPRARVARLPGLPGHLRDRDDQVRRRDPARLVVPREDRHVHQRRAAPAAGRGRRNEPPGAAKTDFEILTTVSKALGLRHGLRDAQRRDGRDRRDDAALRRHQPRARRPRRPPVAGRPRRHRHADPLRGALRARGRPGHVRAAARTSRPATRPTTSSR